MQHGSLGHPWPPKVENFRCAQTTPNAVMLARLRVFPTFVWIQRCLVNAVAPKLGFSLFSVRTQSIGLASLHSDVWPIVCCSGHLWPACLDPCLLMILLNKGQHKGALLTPLLIGVCLHFSCILFLYISLLEVVWSWFHVFRRDD